METTLHPPEPKPQEPGYVACRLLPGRCEHEIVGGKCSGQYVLEADQILDRLEALRWEAAIVTGNTFVFLHAGNGWRGGRPVITAEAVDLMSLALARRAETMNYLKAAGRDAEEKGAQRSEREHGHPRHEACHCDPIGEAQERAAKFAAHIVSQHGSREETELLIAALRDEMKIDDEGSPF